MSTSLNPNVLVTDHGDGSADFTVTVDDEDHKFSASAVPQSSNAELTYEETLSWRGEIRVKEPRHEVWRALMQSDEMGDFLESHGLTGVVREKH